MQSECIARPQGPGKQFTFQIKHHIQMKIILFMMGLSNIFKWISMYDIYYSDAPSGLICGFLYLCIQFITTCCLQEVYYIVPVFCSQNELPEPEQDNGGTTESVKEQEMKWTDLALQYLHENVPPTGN